VADLTVLRAALRHCRDMLSVITLIAMAVFAVVTAVVSRRDGSGISRRPFNKPYTDAPGARTE
jgi:hypothetical protein